MLPPLPRCSRWASSSLIHPAVSAFPDTTFGSACTSTFSRFAQRSLALRPAHSRGHQIRDRYPGASDISSPPCLPRLLPAGAIAGRGLHPLEKRRLVTAHAAGGSTGGALTTLADITAGSTGNLLATANNGAINVTGAIGLTAGSNIVLASNGAFAQSGTLTVKSPDLVIDTTGKDAATLLSQFQSAGGITNSAVITNPLFKPSGNSNPITLGGTVAAGNSVVLLLANKGNITGGSSGSPTIAVGQLG